MAIDEDGDMSISEFEFLRFMLSSADIVDAEALDSLHKRFQVYIREIVACATILRHHLSMFYGSILHVECSI